MRLKWRGSRRSCRADRRLARSRTTQAGSLLMVLEEHLLQAMAGKVTVVYSRTHSCSRLNIYSGGRKVSKNSIWYGSVYLKRSRGTTLVLVSSAIQSELAPIGYGERLLDLADATTDVRQWLVEGVTAIREILLTKRSKC